MLLSELQKDMRFEGFLLVRSAEQRTSNANGTRYLDMTLCDRSGEVNAKVWDGSVQPPPSGSVVKVRALMQEYNGRPQLRVERIRARTPQDEVDMSLLTRCAPESPEHMMKEISDTVEGMAWTGVRNIVRKMLEMTGEKLLYYPAAQRLHHAEKSGLLHHTVSMLRAAKALLPVYPELNGDLLLAGVIIHDLSKVTELVSDEMGNVADYSVEGMLLGHLVDGVAQVREAARLTQADAEAALLLSHMVISHHGQSEFGSPKPPMFPEAEALHMLDDMDAKLNEMFSVAERTPAGVFSEKIWSLDRRLYHPRYEETKSRPGTEAQEPQDAAGVKNSAPRPSPARRQDAYDNLL